MTSEFWQVIRAHRVGCQLRSLGWAVSFRLEQITERPSSIEANMNVEWSADELYRRLIASFTIPLDRVH